MSYRNDDREAIDAFARRYDLFVAKHGELYENSEQPMSDEEVGKLRSLYFVLGGVPFTIASGIVIYSFVTEVTFDRTGLIFLTLFYVVAASLIFKGLSTNKANKKKTIVKAVITRRNVGSHPHLWLSERDQMAVSDADARAYALGDVVEVEIIGSFFLEAGYKIKYLGRISEHGDIHEPTVSKEALRPTPLNTDSMWARAGRALGKKLK